MEKRFSYFLKSSIVSLLIIVCSYPLFAQTRGGWVEKKLPDVIPTDKYYAVGENCLVYVNKYDTIIYAFDLISRVWHEHTQLTAFPWKSGVRAGKDVAMVYNDDIVTAYSAVSQNFYTLSYEGTLLGGTVTLNDCHENVGYFITEQYFYVFDSETSQWFSHQISGFGAVSNQYIYAKPGYILLKLYDASGNEKLIAFSTGTNSFFELNYSYKPTLETLDYGFIVWDNNSGLPDEDRFFGCYSTIHDTWTEFGESEYFRVTTTSDAKYLIPRTVYMFRVSTPLTGSDIRHTFYIFNTLKSDACVVSREYDDDVNDLHDIFTGAQTAVMTFSNVNNNTLELWTYKSETHSMNPVITSPLIFEGGWGRHLIGGKIYLAWDLSHVMGGYPEGQLMSSELQPAGLNINNIEMDIEPRDDWGIIISEYPASDSASIYSYNSASGSTLTRFNTECGNYSFSEIGDNDDVACVLSATPSGYKLYLYSPAYDDWTLKESGPENPNIELNKDFLYYHETNSNILSVFNGVTRQSMDLPFGQISLNALQDYSYSGDDFLVAYTTDNKYVSYSAITGTSNEFTGDRYSYYLGEKSIMTCRKAYNNYNILTYNAIYDSFIHLTLTDIQGYQKGIKVGGETALVVANNGYLLAFNPYKDISTDTKNNCQDTYLPDNFQLDQNYPNPFNTVTSIRISLSVPEHVRIDIYNAQGHKIRTLIDEKLVAGQHVIGFDSEGLSGGIYFYKLTAGSFQQCKKMLLLK